MRTKMIMVLVVMSLLIMTGCTEEKKGIDGNATSKQAEDIASQPNSEKEHTDDNQQLSGEKVGEQVIDNEAYYALQTALDWSRSFDSLDYNSYSQTSIHNLNPDNPSTILEYYYVSDDQGSIQREPAIAHTRNHSVRGEYELIDEYNYNEIDSYHTFSDYYVAKDHGLYYHYDDVGEWFREDLSNDFRTMEHVEELIELFMQYPDQLIMKKNELEEGFEGEGVTDEDFYTISLDLSNDQFVDIVPLLNSNFFTGTYDSSQYYDDQTFMLISTDLRSYNVSLTLDKDYGMVAFDASFEGDILDGSEGEDYQFNLSLYFFNFNSVDDLAIPEEVLLSASDVEMYLE